MADLGTLVTSFGADLGPLRRSTMQAETQFRRFQKSGVAALSKVKRSVFSLQTALAGLGLSLVAKSFVSAASEAENYRVRLRYLLGSVEEGNRLFREMADYAGRVPFEYRNVMGAATALSGVMKGGVEEVKEWMPMIGDLAAVAGLSIEETTSQVIRMYSAGAAAADMFRERGILAMMGFQAGVHYSAEETRRMMMEAWKKADSQFRGATEGLSRTWEGAMSMISDAWFQFRNLVMEAGVFDFMKEGVGLLLDRIKELKKEGRLDDWAREMADKVLASFKAIILGAAAVSDALRGWKEIFRVVEIAWLEYIAIPLWEGLHKIRKAATTTLKLLNLLHKFSPTGVAEKLLGITSEIEKAVKNSERILNEQKVIIAGYKEELLKAKEALADLVTAPTNYEKAKEIISEIEARVTALREAVQASAAGVTEAGGAGNVGMLMEEYIKKAKELAAIEYAPPFDWEQYLPPDVVDTSMDAYIKKAKELAAIEYPEPFDWEQYLPPSAITPTIDTDAQVSALRDMYSDMGEYGQDYTKQVFKLIDMQAKKYEDLKIEQNLIDKWVTKEKKKRLDEQAQLTRDSLARTAGNWADFFKYLGKENKAAFKAYKLMAITEAIINTYSAAVAAYKSTAVIPVIGPALAPVAAAGAIAAGLANVEMIRAQKMHTGGIVGESGTLKTVMPAVFDHAPRAHEGLGPDEVPIIAKKDEGIFTPKQMAALAPVGSGESKTVNIIMNNPVFQDQATLRRVYAEMATQIAERVAPGAVVRSYHNDGRIRSIIRGRA